MEIYHDLDTRRSGHDVADEVPRRADSMAVHKEELDKENVQAARVASNANARVAGLGLRPSHDARVGMQYSWSVRESRNGPSVGNAEGDEDLKGGQPRAGRSQWSQRTVLEDVTHRYNSSSSESYSISEDMVVEREGVDEAEVMQPMTTEQTVGNGAARLGLSTVASVPATSAGMLRTRSSPMRVRQPTKKRVLDKSFTRRMR